MDNIIVQHEWPKVPYEVHPELGLSSFQKFDLIFADPPYNYGVDYADDETRDKLPPSTHDLCMRQTIEILVENYLRPGGVLFWLCPAEQARNIWQHVSQLSLDLLYDRPIIWHERFAQYQQKRLTADYRMLFPIRKPGGSVTFNPDSIREESERQRMGDKRADPRGRVPGHVWRIRRLQGTATDRVDWHPAQLPPEAMERILLGWSNRGDLVMDAYAGSGVMAEACKKHGRNFVGVDKSPTYCEKIRRRVDGTTEQ